MNIYVLSCLKIWSNRKGVLMTLWNQLFIFNLLALNAIWNIGIYVLSPVWLIKLFSDYNSLFIVTEWLSLSFVWALSLSCRQKCCCCCCYCCSLSISANDVICWLHHNLQSGENEMRLTKIGRLELKGTSIIVNDHLPDKED